MTKIDINHTTICDHSPEWAIKFKTEAEQLKKIFGSELLAIHHIGSTSIPQLISKPIIDVAVVVNNPQTADKFIKPLSELGYRYDQPASSSERHFFRKGSPTEYHLSICYVSQGGFLKRQLLFRDYLLAHPESRDEYTTLKNKLISEDPTGKNSYIKGKVDFVNKILRAAGFDFR